MLNYVTNTFFLAWPWWGPIWFIFTVPKIPGAAPDGNPPVRLAQAAVTTASRMNDPHFTMSIYEEAGDVFFKGHRNRMASLPFFRVRGLLACIGVVGLIVMDNGIVPTILFLIPF